MSGEIGQLLTEIEASTSEGSFAVRKLASANGYYVGRDGLGRAALLIKATGAHPCVPIQLAGIEARFAVQCSVSEAGMEKANDTFSVILCLSSDAAIESYFSLILESLVSALGPNPTTVSVSEAVDHLVELFQKLQQPPQRSLTGLVGELCILVFASNAIRAIAAWRIDPDERFDFSAGNLRLDVKASSRRQRSHEVSYDQANPPAGARALFASLWIEPAGGGVSVSSLLSRIEDALGGDAAAIAKLRRVVAETLGNTLPSAMRFTFDITSARDSLQLYDASSVPAIRAPIGPGLSGIRFVSNFGISPIVSLASLRASLPPIESALLPQD